MAAVSSVDIRGRHCEKHYKIIVVFIYLFIYFI